MAEKRWFPLCGMDVGVLPQELKACQRVKVLMRQILTFSPKGTEELLAVLPTTIEIRTQEKGVDTAL